MLAGVVSVILSGLFSLRTAQSRHRFELEKDKRIQQQSALRAAQSVYEPLALAAAELQSKIYNIVQAGRAGPVTRYSRRDDYPEVSTAYFFANYLGWIEARREAILASTGNGERDLQVQRLIGHVCQALRRDELGDGFSFLTAEQRGIGEVMFSWESLSQTETKEPHVLGYAAFVDRYRGDAVFRSWFDSIGPGLKYATSGDHQRLIEIHTALVDLVRELDPEQMYTSGHKLQSLGDDSGE